MTTSKAFWGIVAVLVAAAFAVVLFSGCGPASSAVKPPALPAPATLEELAKQPRATLVQRREVNTAAIGRLEVENRELGRLIRSKRQEELRAWLYLAVVVLAAGALACGALAVWFRMKALAYGALVCLALAALAWFLAVLVPYLVWIGVATLLLGGAWAYHRLREKNLDLGEAASVMAEELKDRFDTLAAKTGTTKRLNFDDLKKLINRVKG